VSFDRALFRTAQVGQVGLNHIKRPRRLATRARIHKNCRVISIEQSVGKVVTSDAEVSHSNIARQFAAGQASCNFNSEGVIAQKYVSDSGDENLVRFGRGGVADVTQRFNFVRSEEEAVARLSHQTNVSPGIIIYDHTDVNFSLVILLDGFDDGGLTCKRDVQDVPTRPGMEPDAAAGPHLDVRDAQVIGRLAATFGVAVNRVDLPGGDYTMDHTAVVFLLDDAARIVAIFTPPFEVTALTGDLKRAAPYLHHAAPRSAT